MHQIVRIDTCFFRRTKLMWIAAIAMVVVSSSERLALAGGHDQGTALQGFWLRAHLHQGRGASWAAACVAASSCVSRYGKGDALARSRSASRGVGQRLRGSVEGRQGTYTAVFMDIQGKRQGQDSNARAVISVSRGLGSDWGIQQSVAHDRSDSVVAALCNLPLLGARRFAVSKKLDASRRALQRQGGSERCKIATTRALQ